MLRDIIAWAVGFFLGILLGASIVVQVVDFPDPVKVRHEAYAEIASGKIICLPTHMEAGEVQWHCDEAEKIQNMARFILQSVQGNRNSRGTPL